MTKYTIVRAGQKRRNTEGSTSASDSFGSKTSAVWILNGTTITQRFIKTGLEDGTQVQVISGLAPGDEVVNGVQAGKVQTNSEAKSPFMPQRRSNQRPAGSGGDNRPSR
jgi:HlyD family secretion protein